MTGKMRKASSFLCHPERRAKPGAEGSVFFFEIRILRLAALAQNDRFFLAIRRSAEIFPKNTVKPLQLSTINVIIYDGHRWPKIRNYVPMEPKKY